MEVLLIKKVSEMLKPPTKETAEKDKTCYMINDINVVSLGNVGDTVDVLVLVTIEEGYKYAICPLDYYLTNHVYDVMPKLTKAYCESSDYYIPREKELCLALYEDDWYRATCLCRSETLTTSSVSLSTLVMLKVLIIKIYVLCQKILWSLMHLQVFVILLMQDRLTKMADILPK